MFSKKSIIQESGLPNLPYDIFNYNISPNLTLRNAGYLSLTCKQMKNIIDQSLVTMYGKKLSFSDTRKIMREWMRINIAIKNIAYPQEYDKLWGSCVTPFTNTFILLGMYARLQVNNSHGNTVNGLNHNLVNRSGWMDIQGFDKLDRTRFYLNTLQEDLIKAKKPINPYGDLVKRISYIQCKLNIHPINLVELCFRLSDKNIFIEKEFGFPDEIWKIISENLSNQDLSHLSQINHRMNKYINTMKINFYGKIMARDEANKIMEPITSNILNITYPSPYDAICGENLTFDSVVLLLKDYCGSPTQNNYESMIRFFNGRINNSHDDTMRTILESIKLDEKPDLTDQSKIINLLQTIEKALFEAKKPMNSKGELVKRIDYVQKKLKLSVIDLVVLCAKLSENYLKAGKSAISPSF